MDGEAPVVARMYDLLRWLIGRVDSLPRSRRFTLGDRIETTATDILLTLVEAQYTRERRALLARANRDLAKLRVLIRLCHDTALWSTGQYEHASRFLVDIGSQVGGWAKAS